jgi:hypothetical protein
VSTDSTKFFSQLSKVPATGEAEPSMRYSKREVFCASLLAEKQMNFPITVASLDETIN